MSYKSIISGRLRNFFELVETQPGQPRHRLGLYSDKTKLGDMPFGYDLQQLQGPISQRLRQQTFGFNDVLQNAIPAQLLRTSTTFGELRALIISHSHPEIRNKVTYATLRRQQVQPTLISGIAKLARVPKSQITPQSHIQQLLPADVQQKSLLKGLNRKFAKFLLADVDPSDLSGTVKNALRWIVFRMVL